MSYSFKFPHRLDGDIYKNAKGNTECVEFVRSVTGAPHTSLWKKGKNVKDAAPDEIPFGTAIATFDDNGKYPTDDKGKHAAIYVNHGDKNLYVYDQFKFNLEKKTGGKVTSRAIRFNRDKGTYRSNNGDDFYIIE